MISLYKTKQIHFILFIIGPILLPSGQYEVNTNISIITTITFVVYRSDNMMMCAEQ